MQHDTWTRLATKPHLHSHIGRARLRGHHARYQETHVYYNQCALLIPVFHPELGLSPPNAKLVDRWSSIARCSPKSRPGFFLRDTAGRWSFRAFRHFGILRSVGDPGEVRAQLRSLAWLHEAQSTLGPILVEIFSAQRSHLSTVPETSHCSQTDRECAIEG